MSAVFVPGRAPCAQCRILLYSIQGAAVPAVGGYFHRSHRGEVVLMVTYSELFQLLMLLVAFAGLIIQICKRK